MHPRPGQDLREVVIGGRGPQRSQGQSRQDHLANEFKKGSGNVGVQQKYGAGGNKASAMSAPRGIDDEEETFSVKKISSDVAKNIQKARSIKGITQKELGVMISEQAKVIADYEAGKAIPNPAVITKMERAMGLKLRGKQALEELQKPNQKAPKAAPKK